MIKALVDNDNNDEENDSLMSDEQFAEVEQRAKSLEAGKSKMYTWEEVKSRILKKNSQKK